MPFSPAAGPLSSVSIVCHLCPSVPGPVCRLLVGAAGCHLRGGDRRAFQFWRHTSLFHVFDFLLYLKKRLLSPAFQRSFSLPGSQFRGLVFVPWCVFLHSLRCQSRSCHEARFSKRVGDSVFHTFFSLCPISVLFGAQLVVAHLLSLCPLSQGPLCHRFTGVIPRAGFRQGR